MLHLRKGVALVLLCLLLASSLLPVHAAEPEPDHPGSLTLRIQNTETHEPVPGGQLVIYQAAELVPAVNGYVYHPTEQFSAAGFDPSEVGTFTAVRNTEQASVLYAFAEDNELSPMASASPDDAGAVLFEDLPLGVYLVVQAAAAPDYEPIDPFLVTIPQVSGDDYLYDVDASPKVGIVKPTEPTEPTQPTTKPDKPQKPVLPQTGQLRWPVYPLAIGGLALFVGGLLCRRKRRHE